MGNEILAMQDILERVLLFSDVETLASCSIVNKQWSPISNRFLWSSLTSQRPLLELLAPLLAREDSYGEYETLDFDPTQRIGWERFHLYAPYVKRLTIQTSHYHYSLNVVGTIALWRESLSILPNLEELKVDCGAGTGAVSYQVDFASLFLSKSLRVLQIKFDNVDDDIEHVHSTRESGVLTFEAFLDAVPKRSPDIRSISLWAGREEDELCTLSDSEHLRWIKTCLTGLLSSLHNLQTIRICPTFMHPALLLALSNLPNLKHMVLFCHRHAMLNYWSWAVTRSSLASLETISLASTFSTALSFLSSLALPIVNSFILTVQSHEVETVDILQKLISTIGQKLPLLEELCFKGHLTMHEDIDPTLLSVGPRSLHYLTSLSQLRVFSFDHEYELHLSQSDFEHLVSHWPLLEELRLPSSKVPTRSSPFLTPHALVALAQYCPRLRRLIIEVDWDNADVFVDGDLFASPGIDLPYKFASLESVDFGRSRVEENQTAAVAVLLVDLSIPPIAIQISANKLGGQEKEEREALTSTWKDIKKLMTIAAHYRRRMKRLQDRVEVLEARSSESITSQSPSLDWRAECN